MESDAVEPFGPWLQSVCDPVTLLKKPAERLIHSEMDHQQQLAAVDSSRWKFDQHSCLCSTVTYEHDATPTAMHARKMNITDIKHSFAGGPAADSRRRLRYGP